MGAIRQTLANEERLMPQVAEAGLILLDLSLNAIAFDKGAAAILSGAASGGDMPGLPHMPTELLDLIRRQYPAILSSNRQACRIGERQYTYRAYLIESKESPLSQALVAVCLERHWTVSNAMSEVANTYHLTEREREVLIGLASMGLTNKEMAERMNISPNTVKLFLRLIMVKMGVTTRAGIVAKILQEQRTMMDGPSERKKAI
jgi:DNA-binding NarL/FixJ family response regulator